MRVYLGSDHAGFELKALVVEHLTSLGVEAIDVGARVHDAADDYPAYCIEVARLAVDDAESLGIVIGGSGNGEQIAANKVPGCRAALAWSVETARLAREHNDAHVIGLGARMHPLGEALAIVEAFLAAPFSEEDRHSRRIGILAEYERTGVAPTLPGG